MSARGVLTGLVLAWLSAGNVAGAAPSHAIILCFGNQDSWVDLGQCFTAVDRLSDCGIRTTLRVNPEPADIDRLKGHPAGTPVFAMSHGITGAEGKHYLVSNMGFRRHFRTRDLVNQVQRVIPRAPVWISACHSGRVCEEGDCTGVGTDSQTAEFSFALPYSFSPPVETLFGLMCDRRLFARYARRDGVVAGRDLERYFTERLPSFAYNEACRVSLREIDEDYRHVADVPLARVAAAEVGCAARAAAARVAESWNATVATQILYYYALRFTAVEDGKAYTRILSLFRTADEAQARVRNLFPEWPKSCGRQVVGYVEEDEEIYPRMVTAVRCSVDLRPIERVYFTEIRRFDGHGGRPSTRYRTVNDGTISITPEFSGFRLE